jgi:hypothetical protein
MNPRQTPAACLKILVTSQKGGVGKSTISANTSAYFSKILKKHTTLLDLDPHGSSSSWVSHALPAGVIVQHHPLPLASGDNRALLDARIYLRRAIKSSEVVITDLTWSNAINGELLFDFDLVLIPVSVSAIEIAATLNFLNSYKWVFDSKVQIPPTLIVCPSRVTAHQLSTNPFNDKNFPVNFMLAPPVIDAQEAKDLFEVGYLFDFKDERGALFENFAAAIVQAGEIHQSRTARMRPHVSDVRKIHGESKVLNRFLIQNSRTQAERILPSTHMTAKQLPQKRRV